MGFNIIYFAVANLQSNFFKTMIFGLTKCPIFKELTIC